MSPPSEPTGRGRSDCTEGGERASRRERASGQQWVIVGCHVCVSQWCSLTTNIITQAKVEGGRESASKREAARAATAGVRSQQNSRWQRVCSHMHYARGAILPPYEPRPPKAY